MGKFLMSLLVGCMLLSGFAFGQREHFVYLQTEDLTPFYVKLNGKTISSTSSGYLILGNMKDTIYPIKLGVLGSDEVQDYGLKVEGRNAGYLVKKLGEKGWGIVDLQSNTEQASMEWSSAIAAETARQEFVATEQKRVADSAAAASAASTNKDLTDPAKVAVAAGATVAAAGALIPGKDTAVASHAATTAVADTASKMVAEPKTEQQRYADSIAAVIAEKEKELKELQAILAGTAGTAVVAGKSTEAAKAEQKETTATEGKKEGAGVVAATAAGLGVVAAVASNDKNDKKESKSDSTATDASKKTAAVDTATKAPVFLDMSFEAQQDSVAAKDTTLTPTKAVSTDTATTVAAAGIVVDAAADSIKPKPVATVAPDSVGAKSDSLLVQKGATDSVAAQDATKIQRQPCTDILGREDVEALMTKASSLTDTDEVVSLYKNAFKEKCVSTSNLKKICNGIASDVTRYRVFEAAYPHTLDFYAFGDLSSLLKDPYYVTKFKTLVQQ